uniref:NADH-ubiquinone oxidoreductase chain 6 n=1 Tax=Liriomyza huidobrensis TaxID=127405 RepID=R4HI73_LIRHU|nr:ND6 gene product [Liriomyza huidobrensis]AEO51720.1 NADH dehydrogenase subunit 6 [Liriomyza huidobrensis]AFL93381.1 NADH dehydrogenase subunit 6 [Liriomyza huidobrensis]
MLQFMLYCMLTISSLIFLQMTHPLAMGLMLLVQTTLMSLLTGMIMKTFWFSYILFLIFLGGMLVLFIYTTSLASNEMFSFSMKLMLITMTMFFLSFIMSIIIDKTMIYNMFMNTEMMNLNNMLSFTPENTINLYKLYNYPTNFTTILLVNYLLITMIAVVKITNLFFGPLRMMN